MKMHKKNNATELNPLKSIVIPGYIIKIEPNTKPIIAKKV